MTPVHAALAVLWDSLSPKHSCEPGILCTASRAQRIKHRYLLGRKVSKLFNAPVRTAWTHYRTVIPVVGDVTDTESWTPLIATVDVVIDAVGSPDNSTLAGKLVAAAASAAKSLRPSHAPKLTYIYTSGTWVHGENRKDTKTDTSPLTEPIPLVAWRPAVEQQVVTNPDVNGIVIRPALVYGRSGSITAQLFQTAYNGKVSWYGTPGGRWAVIHTDDVAELFLLAAEKAALVGGKIFDAANDTTVSVDDLLSRILEVSGAQGPFEYVKPENREWLSINSYNHAAYTMIVFQSAIATTSLLRPYLARSLLGWHPKKAGLIEGLETYYNAWKAAAKLK